MVAYVPAQVSTDCSNTCRGGLSPTEVPPFTAHCGIKVNKRKFVNYLAAKNRVLNMKFTLHFMKRLRGMVVDRDPVYCAHRFRHYPTGNPTRVKLMDEFIASSDIIITRAVDFLKARKLQCEYLCAMPSEHPEIVNPIYAAAKQLYPEAKDLTSCFRKAPGVKAGNQSTHCKQLFEVVNNPDIHPGSKILIVDDIYAMGNSAGQLSALLSQLSNGEVRINIAVLLKVEPNLP